MDAYHHTIIGGLAGKVAHIRSQRRRLDSLAGKSATALAVVARHGTHDPTSHTFNYLAMADGLLFATSP
jgi:hypothetical protein